MRNFFFLFVIIAGCPCSCVTAGWGQQTTANFAVPNTSDTVSATKDCGGMSSTLVLVNGAEMRSVWISLLGELGRYISQLPDNDDGGGPTIIRIVVMFGSRPLDVACGTTSAVAEVLRKMVENDDHRHISLDDGYVVPATDLGPITESILCKRGECSGQLVYIFRTSKAYTKEYWKGGHNPTTGLLAGGIETSLVEVCSNTEEPVGQWMGVEGAIRYKVLHYERTKSGRIWVGPNFDELL